MIAGSPVRPLFLRIARGLIAYGVVGLGLALIATIAVVLAIGRLGSIADIAGSSGHQLGAVLHRMTTVLDDASASADSFGSTIDTSSAALNTAAADLRAIVPQLRDIDRQATAINILGSQPLAPLASLFGQIAGQLNDLDTQIDGVASSLVANRSALTANAASLGALARETRNLGDSIAPDALARTVGDVRWFAIALLAVVVAGVGLPAGGALAFGWWLRRELLSPGGSTPA